MKRAPPERGGGASYVSSRLYINRISFHGNLHGNVKRYRHVCCILPVPYPFTLGEWMKNYMINCIEITNTHPTPSPL